MQKFGWAYQRTGFNGTSNPGQSAVRRALVGMGDYLVRGSRILWTGVVPGTVLPEGLNFLGPGLQNDLQASLQAQGFGDITLDWHIESLGWVVANYRIIVYATTPIDFNDSKDAFSVINGEVWRIYGAQPQNVTQQILNSPKPDSSGVPRYTSAPANIQNQPDSKPPNPCDVKTGWDWFTCQLGFDSAAAHLGLGAGAGAVLALGAIIVTGLVILKK